MPLSKDIILQLIRSNRSKIGGYGVKKLGLFGSFLRGDHTLQSDVDLLVEFDSGKKNYHNFIHLAFLCEDLFQRKVDLLTPESVSPYLKSAILKETHYVQIST